MNDNLNKLLLLGIGTLAMTKDKVEEIVDELVSKGEVAKNESSELINEFLNKGEKTKEELKKLIKDEIAKFLKEADIASKKEMDSLKERIEKLEEKEDRPPV